MRYHRAALLFIISVSMLQAACDPGSRVAPAAQPAVTTVQPPTVISPTTLPTRVTPSLPSSNSTGKPIADRAGWKLYTDSFHGFEFRYPETCQVSRGASGEVAVGSRIELAIEDAGGLPLPTYVDHFVDQRTKAGGWLLETRRAENTGSRQAIEIEYRFGGAGRFGTALFIEDKGLVYVWNLTAGGFTCGEPDVYPDIVASFRFLE